MQFGFTLKPDHTIERTLALTRQAEAAGFDHAWLFDSHVLWRDPYPLLTLMAEATDAPPARHVRDKSRDPRAVESPRRLWPPSTSCPRRPDGPGHRARGLRTTGAGQAAHDDGPPRGRDPGHPRAGRRRDGRLRGYGCSNFPWTPRLDAAGVGRRVWPDGARDDGSRRGRGHPAARRPGPRRVVRRPAARRPRLRRAARQAP